MKDITITTFRGYAAVKGETTLRKCIEETRNGKHLALIKKIERLMAEKREEEANRVKAQLPYLTLTGNYTGRRLPDGIIRYNRVITLDIDKLHASQIGPIRKKIKDDPHVLASFLSPRRHGFKFFVYLCTPYAVQLRQSTFGGVTELTYDALERHHHLMYQACREYYEALLGVEIDTSGKDIGRGFFVSFDVEAYLNERLMAQIEEWQGQIKERERKEEHSESADFKSAETRDFKFAGTKTKRDPSQAQDDIAPWRTNGNAAQIPRLGKEGCPKGGVVDEDFKSAGTKTKRDPSQAQDDIAPWIQMEYRKALATTRRNERFEPGNRDVFLFSLGNRCFRKGLPEKEVVSPW